MKWLTTVEMIEKIKTGEVAKSNPGELFYVKRNGKNLEMFRSRHELKRGTPNDFTVNDLTAHRLWYILPEFVSFEEATEALRDGKEIEFHKDGKSYLFDKHHLVNNLKDSGGIRATFRDLLEGKWSIV